jgi:site-specific DNA recombinase
MSISGSKVIGGIPLGRGALGYLLKNRMYIGELNHRGRSYPGEHPAIVDRDLFAAVQTKLAESRAADHHRQAASEALLIGRIFDDSGNRMTPTHSRKNGARYRYYTSRALSEGRRDEAGSVTRVPAPDVEALVVDAVRHLRSTVDNDPSPLQLPLGSKSPGSSEPSASSNGRAELSASADRAIIAANLDRIVIRPKSIDVHLSERGAIGQAERLISIAWVKPANQRRREVVPPPNGDGANRRAMRADARAILVEAIIKARTWLNEIVSGDVDSVEAIAAREKRSERSIRMTLSLAFLAPDIIAAAVEGTLPRGLGLSRLTHLPGDWLDQRKMLGAFSGS